MTAPTSAHASHHHGSPCGIALALALAFVACASPEAAPPPQGEASAPVDRLQDQLARHEYAASPTARGLQAPNRRHGLRTYFSPDGVRVVDRTAAGAPDLVTLSLERMGRADALAEVPPGEVRSRGARVEIAREELGLVEWYINADRGLEQGFTLETRPEGTGKLLLESAATHASVVVQEQAISFESDAGRSLRFAKLHVEDSEGRVVASRFAERPGGFAIEVDDAGAAYPLWIDPLLTSSFDAELESNQANAGLGASLASAGDVDGDGFEDVIVGAPSFDSGESNEGAAFVFLGGPADLGDGNPINAHAMLEGDQANAGLGASVASAGDVNGDGYDDVAVGAATSGTGGAVNVFFGGPDGLSATSLLGVAEPQTLALFGTSVASAGDLDGDGRAELLVGARWYDGGQANEGAVFVVHHDGLVERLFEANQAGAGFGTSVASGDVNGDGLSDVIVGAPEFDGASGGGNEGGVFVFLGAEGGSEGGDPSNAYASLESDQTSAWLGRSVAAADVNGDGFADVLAGADAYDGPQTNEGRAFVYHGGGGIADAPTDQADGQMFSGSQNTHLGMSVASAGDVNGDGFGDLIIGAPYLDAGQNNEGAAFVWLGGAGGIAGGDLGTVHAQLESNQAYAMFGMGVATAGDVNGDGYDDVIVGAPRFSNGESFEGAAFLFLGSANGLQDGNPASADAVLEGSQAYADFGWSVASAGDVNGDGYADVVVGSHDYTSGESYEGAAFVFLGGVAGIPDGGADNADTRLESDQSDSYFGFSVAGAGDVDGDGYADVIVGAHGFDAGQENEGAAFIFRGSAQGITDGNPLTADTQLESDQPDANFGVSVAGAGDMNGDGYADVIVGSNSYDTGDYLQGAAFIFRGGAGGIDDADAADAAGFFQGSQEQARLGTSVAGAGDLNGDGLADVVIAVPYLDRFGPNSDEGAALVYYGNTAGSWYGSFPDADAIIENVQVRAQVSAVASAGDVNGDGHGDLVIGSGFYNHTETDDGAAFLFLGSGGIGSELMPRQVRGDGSGVRVAPGGLGGPSDAFVVEVDEIRSPRGRELAKLEVEACPSGVPFGDVTCVLHESASWVELDGSGASFSETVSGLDTGLYRWRARALFTPLTATLPGATPIVRTGRWLRQASLSAAGDVRMLPEPGIAGSLAAGVTLLAGLRRLRTRKSRG